MYVEEMCCLVCRTLPRSPIKLIDDGDAITADHNQLLRRHWCRLVKRYSSKLWDQFWWHLAEIFKRI